MFESVKRYKSVLPVIGLLLLMVLVSACGPKQTSIDANLSTYKIDMAQTSAPAGDITFKVKNNATDMVHEFVIFKTDLDAAQLPVDSDGNVIEDQLQKVDEVELEAGKSQDLKVNLAKGHYAIVCNQPGHYKQGMYVNFTAQ